MFVRSLTRRLRIQVAVGNYQVSGLVSGRAYRLGRQQMGEALKDGGRGWAFWFFLTSHSVSVNM